MRRTAAVCLALALVAWPVSPGAGLPVAHAGATATLLMRLKVMNYYPAQGRWSYMWTRWRPATLDADFARIKALHANTVRIIIQADAFGYPLPQPVMLDRLSWVIRHARRHGLRIQLTLFDHWSQYGDAAGSRRWAQAVLAPYAGDREIAFVELRNELNTADPQALACARALIPYVRTVDGGIPLTLSVAGAAGLSGLQALVTAMRQAPLDFYALHYYGPAERAYTTFAQARRIVAPAPLLIGEAGFSTCPCNVVAGLPTTQAALEAYQDHFYRTVALAARALGLPAPAPWILSDFAPGAMPLASKADDYDFGVYRRDHSLKPAAASVLAFFGGGAISLSFNNGFEAGVEMPLGPMPAEWRVDRATEARFALDTQVAHTGHASALISSSGGDGKAVPAFYRPPITPQVVPGQVYAAAVWARGLNATGSTRVALSWFSASGAYVGQTESAPLPAGPTNWTYLVAQGAAPASAAYVLIYLKSSDNSGTAWFDDVSFTPCHVCGLPGSGN